MGEIAGISQRNRKSCYGTGPQDRRPASPEFPVRIRRHNGKDIV